MYLLYIVRMKDVTASEMPDDAEVLEAVRGIFQGKIPFHQALGLEVATSEEGRVGVRFDFRDELVGNFVRGSLHGGVISAALDAAGGLVAFLDVVRRTAGDSAETRRERLGRAGTIALRVDSLRSGRGAPSFASGYVLRTGNKVAVTRMELHNDEGSLLAGGTGTYLVG